MKFVNEAPWDRILRVLCGAGLLYLAWAGIIAGGWGVVVLVVGLILLVTGAIGFCPLYALLKIRTNKL